METHECNTCHEDLPLHVYPIEFHKDRKGVTRLVRRWQCRNCRRVVNRMKDKKRGKNIPLKDDEELLAYAIKWNKEHPVKRTYASNIADYMQYMDTSVDIRKYVGSKK
jgi:hypothetical protein